MTDIVQQRSRDRHARHARHKVGSALIIVGCRGGDSRRAVVYLEEADPIQAKIRTRLAQIASLHQLHYVGVQMIGMTSR